MKSIMLGMFSGLFANSLLTASPALHEKLPFDPVRSFAAVCQISSAYSVLVVHPSVPVYSVKALIALAKATPGQLNSDSAGVGSALHLAMVNFERAADIRLVHIPYNGAAPAVNDVLAGQLPIMFTSLSTSIDFIRTGRVRALGISSAKRRAIQQKTSGCFRTVAGANAFAVIRSYVATLCKQRRNVFEALTSVFRDQIVDPVTA